MSVKRSNYDKDGKFIGYSVEEEYSGVNFDWRNIPPIDSDFVGMVWPLFFVIDLFTVFFSFIFYVFGYWSGFMFGVGTCAISIIILLIMMSIIIHYLTKPVESGEKWVGDCILSLVILSFILLIHIGFIFLVS